MHRTDPRFVDESLEELRALGSKFYTHIQDLKGWIRTGGPINPIWTRETHALQKELHRTQCRAARRIYTSGQEATQRCLGAFLVRRKQRAWSTDQIGQLEGEYQRRYLDELVACNSVGLFERFGDQDIAFICDFCDGHVVWDDLEGVPSVRSAQENASSPISPVSPTTNNPYWQATGFARSSRQEKQVIFAPIAVANHIAPKHGDWQAKLVCPYCEELGEQPQEEDDEEETWRPDGEFDDVAALQEHLEWQHTAASALPTTIPIALPTATDKCQIM